jgi:hypothetical protein
MMKRRVLFGLLAGVPLAVVAAPVVARDVRFYGGPAGGAMAPGKITGLAHLQAIDPPMLRIGDLQKEYKAAFIKAFEERDSPDCKEIA